MGLVTEDIPDSNEYVDKGAVLSEDGKYRYALWREWRGTHSEDNWFKKGAAPLAGVPKACVFVMLNPSTADADEDDPTIRRCVSFAKQWLYEKIIVLNLFAYRTTNPADLRAVSSKSDPVGPGNMQHVRSMLETAGIVVCAWGNHGTHLGQNETMLGWLLDFKELYCLGLTDKEQPKHPLYLPKFTKLQRFGHMPEPILPAMPIEVEQRLTNRPTFAPTRYPSSNVGEVGRCLEGHLYVRYHSGAVYIFANLAAAHYEGVLNASSPGKYMHAAGIKGVPY